MRHRLVLLLAAFGYFGAGPASAALERFTALGPPQGCLTSLAGNAADHLFATFTASGFSRSEDGGVTWSSPGSGMDQDPARAVAVGRQPHLLFAAGATRFFRSLDAGRTWEPRGVLTLAAEEVAERDVLRASPHQPGLLFLARGHRLLRSFDGGASFTPVLEADSVIQALTFDPTAPGAVYLGSATVQAQVDTFYTSLDHGTTWSGQRISTTGDQTFGVDQITVAGSRLFAVSALALWQSADRGQSWAQVVVARGNSVPAEGFTYQVAADPGNSQRIYAVHQRDADVGLYRSGDGGATWTLLPGESPEADLELRVNARGDAVWSWNAAQVSRVLLPGGIRQVRRLKEHPAGVDLGCAADPRTAVRLPSWQPNAVWVVSKGFLWASTDRGASWRQVAISTPVFDVAVREDRPREAFATGATGVLRSTDGGNKFTLVAPPGERSGLTWLSPTELLRWNPGVDRSTDGGRNWITTLSADGAGGACCENRGVFHLVQDPRDPGVLFAIASEGESGTPPSFSAPLYRSLDRGTTWQLLPGEGPAVAVDPRQSSTLYRLNRLRLERSTDRGDTWAPVADFGLETGAAPTIPANPGLGPGDLWVDARVSNLLWAVRGDGAWRSGDHGVTWHPVPGLEGVGAYRITPDPWLRGRYWVTTARGVFVGRFVL